MWGSFFQHLKGFFTPTLPHRALAQLEELLVVEIPMAVRSAKIEEPVYCLRIWYNGTDSASDAVPWLMLVKESTRQQLLATRAGNDPTFLWSADELTEPGAAYNVFLSGWRMGRLYRKWYRYLCAVEDDEEIQPFREMVQRVARRLNQLRWLDLAPVTDDFVVFPADGSHTFCDDLGDMTASVLPNQLALLRTRNLLPPMDGDEDKNEQDTDHL